MTEILCCLCWDLFEWEFAAQKNTITVTIMLYKNSKAMVRSPDGDTNFFNNVTGASQVNTLASYIYL